MALHTGFETPIFSVLPLEKKTSPNNTAEHSTITDDLHPKGEEGNINEIEFVAVKVEKTESDVDTTNSSEVCG